MKLHIEAPAMLSQRHRFPDIPSLTRPGTTGLKLVLRDEEKKYDDKLEEDELDSDSEKGA
jgi:hypothetical protein